MESAPSWSGSTTLIVTATAVITASLVTLGSAALWPRREKILPSPLKTLLPRLPPSEVEALAYHPDQFPGARDVQTPYGSIRVYEWGPEDGPKVLMVHGISTSCITLGNIAHGLVERGHRVMLYDLFGRGFSDGVGDVPHDERLYVSQILLVLASSSLSWTGASARLKVIGYSLGGGIAVHFANAVPHLVESLILLAPAGLIRAESFGALSNFAFKSGFVPESLLAVLTRRRLQRPIASSKAKALKAAEASAEAYVDVAAAEAIDPPPGTSATPLEKSVLDYVRWMVIHHPGFVPAFMSSVRHAPLTDQHASWEQLARREQGSTVVMLAESDEIIDLREYTRHGLPLCGGEENVVWKVMPGGHDFVMTHSKLILSELDEHWG